MKKELASQIMDAALSIDSPLGEMDSLISQIDDEDEKRAFVEMLGNVMGAASELIFKLERDYPDLNPDK